MMMIDHHHHLHHHLMMMIMIDHHHHESKTLPAKLGIIVIGFHFLLIQGKILFLLTDSKFKAL